MKKLLDRLTTSDKWTKWYYKPACRVWWFLYNPMRRTDYMLFDVISARKMLFTVIACLAALA